MINVLGHKRNATRNDIEISSHPARMAIVNKPKNAGGDAREKETLINCW
jgi:hypothetical protein